MGQTADSCTAVGVGPSAALQNCTPREDGKEGAGCWASCPELWESCLRPPVTPEASVRFVPLHWGPGPASSLPKEAILTVGVGGGWGSVSWPPPSWLSVPLKTQLKSTVHHCQPAGTPKQQMPLCSPSWPGREGPWLPSQGPLACWLTNPASHSRWLPGAAGQAGPQGRLIARL